MVLRCLIANFMLVRKPYSVSFHFCEHCIRCGCHCSPRSTSAAETEGIRPSGRHLGLAEELISFPFLPWYRLTPRETCCLAHLKYEMTSAAQTCSRVPATPEPPRTHTTVPTCSTEEPLPAETSTAGVLWTGTGFITKDAYEEGRPRSKSKSLIWLMLTR